MTPNAIKEAAPGASDVFAGGGQMGELMRSIDWSATPLGPVDGWPQSLKTALSVLLHQRTAVFIFWGPEHVQFYNDAYRPILGTSKHPAAMGQRGRECWPEIWHIIEPMLDAVHRGESTAVEDGLLVMNRHGYLEEGYYTYTYSPIRDESGAVGGVFCIVYDTTARVIGERRLRTLRDLASRAIAREAETACRIAASTLTANPYDVPFATVYLYDSGYHQAHLVGTAGIQPGPPAAPERIDLDDQNSYLAEIARKSHTEELTDFARKAGPLPGGPWPVSAESAIVLPIVVPGQARAAGFLLAGISPRKRLDSSYRTFFELVAGQIGTAVAEARAYEQERQRAEALAELDRAKTAFFSNVSHEFRTPLTLMLGPVADMLARPELPDPYRQELELVHRNASRLLKLVNTLLDFSRIEAGRIHAHFEPTDISAVTADLASVFRSAIEKAGLKLTIDCPPLGEPVYLDRDMWEKIVLNLLSNAFKYTFEGEITVSLARHDGRVELMVRDTGIGIAESEIPHVFDRFHRIEGARGRSMEGSGIGLALVQELTKLHGGSVRVESAIDKGSTFVVSIPLGCSHLPPDRMGEPRAPASTSIGAQSYLDEALRWLPDAPDRARLFEPPSDDGGRPRINREQRPAPRARLLVADDNADMRDYLRHLLAENHEVSTAADGRDALRQIRESAPDLVLADVMMPGLDGFSLLQALRSDSRTATLPVILLSARAGEEASVEGLQAGADDYLVKPFSARELLARVTSRLEIARLRRQTAETEYRLRKEAEAERQRLRDLIVQAPAVIAILRGPEHVFELVNQGYLQATGRSEQDLIGKPVREALPELVNQPFPQLLDTVYRTGRPFVATEMLVKLDRGRGMEDRYFNFVYQPSRDAAGAVEGIIAHAVDVTDQVMARQRIEESERQLRTLADSIPQLAWMAEPDGYIFWYNQQWYEYTGTTPDQMVGWGWESVHDPDILPSVLERWRGSLRTGAPFEMEFPLRSARGEFRWFLTRVTPLRDSSGKIVRWFGTNTDVMELKRVQSELQRSNEELRRANQDLETFAYSASHDLREPLRTIAISAQLLERNYASRLPDSGIAFLGGILEGARRMDTLLTDLLSYTRVTRSIEPAVQPVDANTVLSAVLDNLKTAIAENQAVVTSDPLPVLLIHEAHLSLLLQNLIGNALKYRRQDPPRVHISSSRSDGFWRFSVTDNGIGIDPEYREQVFELFKRLHSRDEFSGSGVGLAICHRLVEHYGGRIWVDSAPGGPGSVFSFTIPDAEKGLSFPGRDESGAAKR